MGMSVTEEILEGGKHWSMRINRGMCLQLSDLEGAGCVGMIAFNAMDPLERLNILTPLNVSIRLSSRKVIVCTPIWAGYCSR